MFFLQSHGELNTPRWFEAFEIIAIAFLASNKVRYVSGLVLDVAAGGNARYTA